MRTRDYDKLERIKEAMVSLILREGMNGASVAKIAREAGVSPATIYVYYSSKEEMLADVFREYSHASFHALLPSLSQDLSGADFIDAFVRGFFDYSVQNEEAFSFVEQCSRCPTLSSYVREEDCCCGIFERIHAYQHQGIFRPMSDLTLSALLLAPVRFLASQRAECGVPEPALSELIEQLQKMLL